MTLRGVGNVARAVLGLLAPTLGPVSLLRAAEPADLVLRGGHGRSLLGASRGGLVSGARGRDSLQTRQLNRFDRHTASLS